MLLWAIIFNKWFVLAVGILFMFMGLRPQWTMQIVRWIGKMGWAESSVGRGGTFTIWKIIGIIAPIAAIIYFFSGGVQVNVNETNNQSQTNSINSQYK